jgi:hypothetical protein
LAGHWRHQQLQHSSNAVCYLNLTLRRTAAAQLLLVPLTSPQRLQLLNSALNASQDAT